MARWVRVFAVLVAAVSLLAAVACSDDDGAATARAAPTSTAAESTTAASTPSPLPPSPEGHLPKAIAYEGCAGAGDFWPTMTLALQGPTLWIACKEEARLVHVNALDGAPLGEVELDSFPIAVVTGFGAVWGLGDTGTIYRIDPATSQIRKEIETGAAAPYNLWIGAGSVWSID
ncbi:MAG TPA: hypothetical protein VFP09_01105, partial [Desertimonas sp.]|nr:hypothetical protein [Desertimonas sp.]